MHGRIRGVITDVVFDSGIRYDYDNESFGERMYASHWPLLVYVIRYWSSTGEGLGLGWWLDWIGPTDLEIKRSTFISRLPPFRWANVAATNSRLENKIVARTRHRSEAKEYLAEEKVSHRIETLTSQMPGWFAKDGRLIASSAPTLPYDRIVANVNAAVDVADTLARFDARMTG